MYQDIGYTPIEKPLFVVDEQPVKTVKPQSLNDDAFKNFAFVK